jgi:N-acetyltransferase
MLDHAFKFVERVVFVIGVTNLRSQRAVEKIGGVRVGPSDKLVARGIVESFVYEIRRKALDAVRSPATAGSESFDEMSA